MSQMVLIPSLYLCFDDERWWRNHEHWWCNHRNDLNICKVVFETFKFKFNLNCIWECLWILWKYYWIWSTNDYRTWKTKFGHTGLPVSLTGLPVALQRSSSHSQTRPDYRLGQILITPDYRSSQRYTGHTPEDSNLNSEEHRTTGG